MDALAPSPLPSPLSDLTRVEYSRGKGGRRPPWGLLPLLLPLVVVSARFLQTRIDRFALERQDAENALVNTSERLFLNEPFESLDTQRELSQSQ